MTDAITGLAHALLGPATLYQTSTIAALLEGVYDGDVTIAELLTHGDFGLGTFNHLDGEMIVLDGVCHHLRADGTAALAGAGDRTPFAAVTYFVPEMTFTVDQPIGIDGLRSAIDDAVGGDNSIVAIRVSGAFSAVRTRTLAAQRRPYPRLSEAIRTQQENTLPCVTGTLAGYRTPAFEQGIAVAGYHLHFLDDTHRRGGHVLDFQLDSARVDLAIQTDLHLSLPRSPEFLAATSSGACMDEEIRNAEGNLTQGP